MVIARSRLKLRASIAIEGAVDAGHVEAGTRLHVLERASAPDGTRRARVAFEVPSGLGPPQAPLGWLSVAGKDGRANLFPAVGAVGGGGAVSARQSGRATERAESLRAEGVRRPPGHAPGLPTPTGDVPVPLLVSEEDPELCA